MAPAHLAGLVCVLGIAYYFSRRIRGDLDNITASEREDLIDDALEGREAEVNARWVANVVLTIIVIAALVAGVTSSALIFMLGLVVALLINVRSYEEQREVLEEHATSVMTYVGILFAAGVLIGVLEGSGMITEMANILVQIIPDSLGNALPLVVGIISMPASLVFSPDAYYFGVLPVLAETASQFGFAPIVMARASIVGQMTVGFPISPLTGATFLLIGLAEVELGEHIKFTFPYMWLTSLVILAVGILIGAIPV